MENLPINDVLDLVRFGCQFGVDTVESFTDDGDLTFTDIPNYVDSLALIPDAVIGIENVIPQIKDIDKEELLQIKKVVFDTVTGVPELEHKWMEIAQEAINASVSIGRIFILLRSK